MKNVAEEMSYDKTIQLQKDYVELKRPKMFFEFIVHSAQSHLNIAEIKLNEIAKLYARMPERALAAAQIIKGSAIVVYITAQKKMDSILRAKELVEAMNEEDDTE